MDSPTSALAAKVRWRLLRIAQGLFHQLRIAQATLDEFGTLIHRRTVTFRKIIENGDRMAGVQSSSVQIEPM